MECPKWLAELIDGLDSADLNPPFGGLEEGEEIIGEITNSDLQKLMCAAHKLVSIMKEKKEEHEALHDAGDVADEICDAFNNEVDLFQRKLQLIKELFWLSVELEYNIVGKNIGVRDGWKIVTLIPKPGKSSLVEEPSGIEFLAMLARASASRKGGRRF